jgi:PRC-barrel domain
MSHPKYLPALRTEARNQGLARLSVRAADDRELGKLVGFVIDPRTQTISSIVLEVADGTGSPQVAVPMVPLRLDAERRALRLIYTGTLPAMAFRPDSVSQVDEDDLWVPFIHSAA